MQLDCVKGSRSEAVAKAVKADFRQEPLHEGQRDLGAEKGSVPKATWTRGHVWQTGRGGGSGQKTLRGNSRVRRVLAEPTRRDSG